VSAPSFDGGTLRRLHEDLGAEEDVTLDIVRTFLQSADDLVREAQAGLAKGDTLVVRRVAHTLKSSAATVGAMRLAEIARDVEARLMGGGAARPEEVQALAEELSRARGPLAAWRAAPTGNEK